MSKASLVKYLIGRGHARHQHRREYHQHHGTTRIEDENTIVVLPSTSKLLLDQSAQVTSSSLESVDSTFQQWQHHHDEKVHAIIPPLPGVDQAHYSSRKSTNWLKRIPYILNLPPEQIRGTILNHGETYWVSSEHCCRFLLQVSSIHATIYALVFILSAPHRMLVALYPKCDTVILWYLILTLLDTLAYGVIRLGKYVNNRWDLNKGVDSWFMLISTILLLVCFVATLLFPVYGSFYLVTQVKGTIRLNDAECLEVRDLFTRAGTGWGDLDELKDLCNDHIDCIDACRDFRGLIFWFYGVYLLAPPRFIVFVSLMNSCRFIRMIKDIHEERVSYSFDLQGFKEKAI